MKKDNYIAEVCILGLFILAAASSIDINVNVYVDGVKTEAKEIKRDATP